MNTKPSIYSPRVLVTGGTGLTGSHLLVELLDKGYHINALYRTEKSKKHVERIFSYYFDQPGKEIRKIHWIQGDITDIPSLEKAFDGVQTVFHTAGLVSFARKDEKKLQKVNAEGTANLINLSLFAGVEKFCHLSSIAVFGNTSGDTLVHEETPWNPDTNNYEYAWSKYKAETEVWRGQAEELNVVVLQPGVIIGPGFWKRNTGRFFSLIDEGFSYYSTGITGFVGVWDVAKAMRLVAEHAVINEKFILVSENMTYRNLLELIASSLHVKPPFKKVNRLAAHWAWRWDYIQSALTGKPRFFTKHTAEAAMNIQRYSPDKFRNTFGFAFEPLKEVIEKTARLYRRDNPR